MKTHQLGASRDDEFFRILVTLALPIIVQNFLVSSLNMLDTLMIGKVGEVELAAVGVANKLYFLFHLTNAGAAAGCSMFMAQYWGGRDFAGIRRVVGVGLCGVLAVAGMFTVAGLFFPTVILGLFSDDAAVIALGRDYLVIVCLSYVFTGLTVLFNNVLRCIGNAKAPMYVSLFAIMCNGVLNYILIFGKLGFPAMGVVGAAIATTVSRFLELCFMLAIVFSRGFPLRGAICEFFDFDLAFAASIARKSAPVIMNEALYALGTWMYTIAYGKIGTGALAAVQISYTVSDMFTVLCFGISGAALVIIGNQIGAGDLVKTRAYARKITEISFFAGLVTGCAVAFAASGIVGFFKISAATASTAVVLLRIQGACCSFMAAGTALIVGVFRGGGDASFALRAEMSVMWCISIPLAFMGAIWWGLPAAGVSLLIQSENIVKFFVGLLHLKRGKWVHILVREQV